MPIENDFCYEDLNEFIEILRQGNDLLEVDEEISTRFEISAVLQSLGQQEGPAALFTNIAGFPGKAIVGNVFGHRRRLAKALGVKAEQLTDKYLAAKRESISPSETLDAPVKNVGFGPNTLNLFRTFPALIHHEGDSSPYFTCGVTISKDPETGQPSMGLHRIQVRSENSLCICMATPPLGNFLTKAKNLNVPLPVAIVVGLEPALLIAAVTWCPKGDDKMKIAGGLKRQPVKVTPCETVDLMVPSSAQYLIEGTINPGDMAEEGCFGESSGIYIEGIQNPVIRVSHISRREQPIYQALQTWSGEDDALLDLCFGSDMLESVQRDFPDVKELILAPGTVAAHCVVSMEKCSKPMVRTMMASLLSHNPFIKQLIVVDTDIDVRNPREVEWAVATRFQADQDLLMLAGLSGSIIDPSCTTDGTTCKIGLDATFPNKQSRSFRKVTLPESSIERAIEIINQHR